MTDKLEMPVEQFAEAVANENARLIRRNEQLVSGPGGIMEMKQTIVDKEADCDHWKYICKAYARENRVLYNRIERLKEYRNLVHFIANDYHELSYEKAQLQRDDWKERCLKVIKEIDSE